MGRRTAKWRWYSDGELISEIEETRRLLQLAQRAEQFNPKGLTSEVPRLERRLNELTERAASEAVLFVVQALPGDDYEDIKRRHPPTDVDLERWREQAKVNPFALMPEFHWQTMAPELLAACLVEPEWSEEKVRQWWKEASAGDRRMLWNVAIGVQVDSVDVPFSDAAIDTTGDGGEPSSTAPSEESL